jgi:hypothetical protein
MEDGMRVSRIVIAGAAALATCGVLGMAPAAAQASSASTPTWTQQTPAAHPPALIGASMAYDAATGTMVLFGGVPHLKSALAETWTWDGTTWTRQHPAGHPSARFAASMAYDAATGTVVLFGGNAGPGNATPLADTWTWDGTTWTRQHPAVHPSARYYAAMAYDDATSTAVLFGGSNGTTSSLGDLKDTWTWDGTTWTQQAPAVHPATRAHAAMAYDAATGTAVLFGGDISNDTWTWDGTTWTKQHPATSPPSRINASMAYDATTGTLVLFGGDSNNMLADTWTWGGTTWTQQAPATSPPARDEAAMAYDAATGTVVLFGGNGASQGNMKGIADTWTWG